MPRKDKHRIFLHFLSLCIAFMFPYSMDALTILPANTIAIDSADTHDDIVAKAAHVVANDRQLKGLADEFIAFIHFGPNTFSEREWGTGKEEVTLFNPSDVDAEQWVSVMKEAGITKVIITAKHHDGYVIWPSRYTEHGIIGSPYLEGKGDVVGQLAEACREAGLKLGIYLSPADLYQIESPEGLYGNGSEKTLRTIPRQIEGRPFANDTFFEFVVDDYNEYFLNQLYELLTDYGPIHEVWFDGANPKEKGGQTYSYEAWEKVIRTLAPDAVIFGIGDVRWGGNEAGLTRKSEWNAIPYVSNPEGTTESLDCKADDMGSRDKLTGARFVHYIYPEIDTSIREGWFHRDNMQKVRSADEIFDIYERSVGGNAVFLLNIPPNKAGRFDTEDVAVLLETGRRIKSTYGNDLLKDSNAPSELLDNDLSTSVALKDSITIGLSTPEIINRLLLQENVKDIGERIEEFQVKGYVDGDWTNLADGTNVGHKRIVRFMPVTIDSVRIVLKKSRLTPQLSKISAHYYSAPAPSIEAMTDIEGRVTLQPKRSGFSWKTKKNAEASTLWEGLQIYYTLDGTEPTVESKQYVEPFFPEGHVIKAKAYFNGDLGPTLHYQPNLPKTTWTIISEDDVSEKKKAIDCDKTTAARFPLNEDFVIDLGDDITIQGFIYSPPVDRVKGLMTKVSVATSEDGEIWRETGVYEFGNIINDPSPRSIRFDKEQIGRYIKFIPAEATGGTERAWISEIDLF